MGKAKAKAGMDPKEAGFGEHGCFFCGASVRIGGVQSCPMKVEYVCTGCGMKVTVQEQAPKKAKD